MEVLLDAWDHAGAAWSSMGRIKALKVRRRVSLERPQVDPANAFRIPILRLAFSADCLQ